MPEPHELPVELLPSEGALPAGEDGSAICLSGGGYRAMVFHVGALWRLYETGILGEVARVSSVSGGSITAGVLALAWSDLSFAPGSVRSDFVRHVVAPIRRMAWDCSPRAGGSRSVCWLVCTSLRRGSVYRS